MSRGQKKKNPKGGEGRNLQNTEGGRRRDIEKEGNMIQLSLYEQIKEGDYGEVMSKDQLTRAFKRVKVNKGAPGIDGQTVEEYGKKLGEEIEKLSNELEFWKYKPNPVLRVEIPKPGTTKTRKLGIPCVRDRVVQESIKMTIEARFEEGFSESSYGFRPNRSQKKALERAKEMVISGKQWIVDIDLDQFFDRINHDKMMEGLKKKVKDKGLLKLIWLILRGGTQIGGLLERSEEGVPQGSPLSPLLSNIILDELDKELEKRDLKHCRYADDCNIYVGSEKAGRRVMKSLTHFIESRLKLKVNVDKSKVARANEVKFLGFTVTKGSIAIAKGTLNRAMAVVKELTPRGIHISLRTQIERINEWYKGWTGYYRGTEWPSQLKAIEGHVRRRLRSRLISDQKKSRNLVKKWLSMGVRKHLANRAYRSIGRWRLSGSGAAQQAWTVDWFKKEGLETMSEKKLPHWKSLRTHIRLT